MEKRVLVVEDDDDIAGLIEIPLRDAGFAVERVSDGTSGLVKATRGGYAIIILDIMLPGISGLDLCAKVREDDLYTPILMITAKSEEDDKVIGLEAGADDYLTKPFGVAELVARAKALVRRAELAQKNNPPSTPRNVLNFEELEIDLDKRKVRLKGSEVILTAMEFDLLAFLASNPGRPFTRQDLLNSVWDYNFEGYEHTVSSHINRLRTKIESDQGKPRFIMTVWGVGYRFCERSELG